LRLGSEAKVGLFVLIACAVLGYMAIQLGAFKPHLRSHKNYIIYFEDLCGLEKKADIKISGVKVGWVNDIELVENGSQAKVNIMIYGKYTLYSDASAKINQDTLLGTKYLDLNPGSKNLFALSSGDSLTVPVKANVSIESLMYKFEQIANNIQDVSKSLKAAIESTQQQEQLKDIIKNINEASKKIAEFTNVLSRNENNLENIINNIKTITNNICPATNDVHKLSETLDDALRNINSVAQKIDKGQGSIGKAINDDEVYNNVKIVTNEIKHITKCAKKVGLVFDTHFEAMTHKAEHYKYPDFKSYFDFRIHPNENLFFLLQLLKTEKGSISRNEQFNEYFNSCGKELKNEKQINKLGCAFDFAPFETHNITLKRNAFKFGFQVGGIYKCLALRVGIFENTAGIALDCELPFNNNLFRWVTSLEAFDFRGQDRICDRRPHLKWINRLFLSRNFYFDFGADDFVSKNNSRMFFGLGFRFGNDDLKYLLPS
jgi:phospholipid/cholesterol/gamma-HCH transport system substrate-binding protein